jgi:hypothetical protein
LKWIKLTPSKHSLASSFVRAYVCSNFWCRKRSPIRTIPEWKICYLVYPHTPAHFPNIREILHRLGSCALTHKRIVCTQGETPFVEIARVECVLVCARERVSISPHAAFARDLAQSFAGSISKTRKFAFTASSFRGVAMQMTC